MTTDFVVELAYHALYTVILVASPMLGAGLIVGLLIGIFQAATSIHEMTLTFVPKILAVFIIMIIFMPWMLRTFIGFTINIYNYLPAIAQ